MSRQPDLTFYYSLLLPSTIINANEIGTDRQQTSNGLIFADIDLTIPIGSFAFNIVIYNSNNTDKILYDGTGTNVYFLPEGTLSNSVDLKFIRSPLNLFVLPPTKLNVYQILSGSLDFLNSRGIITQETLSLGLKREVNVYFDK